MSHKNFSLTIHKPCSENWDAMTPQEQGRFCANCQTVVKDFTLMNTSQIQTFFKNHTKEVCGNFYVHQLNREYSVHPEKKPWFMSRFLHFLLSGLLTIKMANSAAQSPPKTEIITGEKTEDNKTGPIRKEDKRWVEGKVIYRNSPLANASITLSGSGQSVQTDEEGKFRYELPKEFGAKEFVLEFWHAGYAMETRYFKTNQLPVKKLTIQLESRRLKGKVAYRPHR